MFTDDWWKRHVDMIIRLLYANLVFLALILASLWIAPRAYADPIDIQYINVVTQQGITGDSTQLIGWGRTSCDAYGTPQMVVFMGQIESAGLTAAQASNVILDGMHVYCPGKAPL